MFGLNFPFTFIVLKLKVWSRVYIKNEGFVWCKNRNVREGICVLFFPPYKSLVLLHEPQDPILQDRQISLVFPHPITIIFICYVYFTLIMKLKLCAANQRSALSLVGSKVLVCSFPCLFCESAQQSWVSYYSSTVDEPFYKHLTNSFMNLFNY